MKKLLIGLFILIAVFMGAIYVFIPSRIELHETVSMNAALPGVSRALTEENNWNKWWPGKTPFLYNGEQFKLQSKSFNIFEIYIYDGADTIKSRMKLVMVKNDSMTIMWNAERPSHSNPFKRFSAYRAASKTGRNMSTLLDHIKEFMTKTENIYGIPIRKTKVADSVLIATRRSFDHPPAVNEIDEMIQSLKKYIARHNAVEKNYPMLNVTRIDSSYYEIMTAIPVDRALPETKDFAPKFLLKGGNIMEGDVKGGPYTIETAFNEFEKYRSDYQYTSPAIPYQLLITDRAKEPDTTKWITKLYYPIL